MSLDAARRVADAVLYEGYLLYPYRASAAKNRMRWQFGVLAPRLAAERNADGWFARTECLLEAADDALVHVQVRFLHLRTRDGWDEGVEREVQLAAPLAELLRREHVEPIAIAAGVDGDWRWAAVDGRVAVRAERLPGPYGGVRLALVVENTSGWDDPTAPRDDALRRAMVGTHALLALDPGSFLSMLDPPEWARAAAEACQNVGTFPVLVGDPGRNDALLSSPIILYDHPAVAPESPGDLFDATEIDEILTLRTLALTDAEKDEARATDPRAAAIVDRSDALPPELLQRLHGAVRSLRPSAPDDPDGATVRIASVDVGPGSRVVLRPGLRRADAQDMFLAGRVATVAGVKVDAEGRRYLAVTLDDDPGADLHRWYGRFLYFDPDEVEPR